MNNNKLLTLVSVIVIVLSVAAGVGLAVVTGDLPAAVIGAQDDDSFEVEIRDGRLPGAEDYPINEDGTGFLYTINTAVTVNKNGRGSIMLENTPGNLCTIEMELVLDETGESIYLSPELEPETCFTQDILEVVPEPGSHNVTAYIYAYDLETGEMLAEKVRQITLTVDD